jgi:hypothetical protein
MLSPCGIFTPARLSFASRAPRSKSCIGAEGSHDVIEAVGSLAALTWLDLRFDNVFLRTSRKKWRAASQVPLCYVLILEFTFRKLSEVSGPGLLLKYMGCQSLRL